MEGPKEGVRVLRGGTWEGEEFFSAAHLLLPAASGDYVCRPYVL